MTIRRFQLLTFLLVNLVIAHFAFGIDEYWIAYSAPEPARPPVGAPSGPKYLLKIDVLGNVLLRPQKVIKNSALYFGIQEGGRALAHGTSGKLNLWVQGRSTNGFAVYRAIIDPRQVSLVVPRKTAIRSASDYIQVTQKGNGDFLAIATPPGVEPFYQGFAVAFTGALIGKKWLLTDTPAVFNQMGWGVSADGRFLFHASNSPNAYPTKFTVQKLSASGISMGKPFVLATRRILSAMDVSNNLGQYRRYALYGVQLTDHSLFVQTFDAKSGIRIGQAIKVAPNAGAFQDAALDPLGRFIVYTSGGRLFYQALDATGHINGNVILLSTNAHGGIDILRD